MKKKLLILAAAAAAVGLAVLYLLPRPDPAMAEGSLEDEDLSRLDLNGLNVKTDW